MRAFEAHDEIPRDRSATASARRRPSAGPVAATLLVTGIVAGLCAHVGPGGTGRDGGGLLTASLLVVYTLAATGAGAELLVQAAREPRRHVFRFGVLRLAAVALLAVGALHAGALLWSGALVQVWASGTVDACVIAAVGSVGAAAGALLFAVIAARLAWRAFLDEYWAHADR